VTFDNFQNFVFIGITVKNNYCPSCEKGIIFSSNKYTSIENSDFLNNTALNGGVLNILALKKKRRYLD
jgi:hypothetical protein